MSQAQEPTVSSLESARPQSGPSGRTDHAPFSTELYGRRLAGARLAWLLVFCLATAVLIAGLWVSYADAVFSSLPEIAGDIDIALYRVFINNQFLSGRFFLFIALCQTAAFMGVGLLLFARRSNEWLTILTSAMLMATGVGFAPNTFFLPIVRPAWWLPVTVLQIILFALLVVFLFLFPDGRFAPRWGRRIALIWVIYALSWLALPELNPHQTSSPIALLFFILVVMIGTAAQVYRYQRVSGVIERQQSKWVLAGFMTTNLCFFLLVSLSVLGITPRLEIIAPLSIRLMNTMLGLTAVFIPITIGVAILRFRLWNIGLFINRALVYGGLTALVLGLYVIVVGGLGVLFQSGNNVVVSVLATGLIAVLFNPLHQRLQRAVNRLMYGDRDDPFTVVTRLGRRLEDTAVPSEMLPVLVETIADALKLPYVGLSTTVEGREQVVAETGVQPADSLRIPLVSQSEQVGYLLAAPRSAQELFTPAESRLLNTIAHQAGSAVRTVQLQATLQHSREQLVLAQEEERRRLQRDLHDGLGPQLATLSMRLEVAQGLITREPEAAVSLLGELKGETQAAIADIRRLVYGLRPPVLDQLGLFRAIREFAASNSTLGGPRLVVDIPEDPLPLPAAVETAAYRITTEALANCLHYAGATECRISLHVDDCLLLEIADNGCGLPDPVTPGVGLTSMRERTAELGGRIVFRRSAEGGTIVIVYLPIYRERPA